eukprot:5896797-Ditylum_brightwellii.AAC.1
MMNSDSFVIHVDNYASACLSHDASHFVSAIVPLPGQFIRATGGTQIKVHDKGTMKWNIQDDNGITHVIYIKDALYVPDAT